MLESNDIYTYAYVRTYIHTYICTYTHTTNSEYGRSSLRKMLESIDLGVSVVTGVNQEDILDLLKEDDGEMYVCMYVCVYIYIYVWCINEMCVCMCVYVVK